MGPTDLKTTKEFADDGGLSFSLDCVTDVKNLCLILKNASMKNPAEEKFLVHVWWLKDKLENGVVWSFIWCDTRDLTADGHTKVKIQRTAVHRIMGGTMTIQHERETL